MLSQVLTVGVGQALVQIISLVRNLGFAAVLSVSDFALASIFLLVVSVVEMVSDIHLDKYIIRYKGLLSNGTLFWLSYLNGIKGILLFLLIFLIVVLLGLEEYWLVLPVISLLISFNSLKVKGFQRDGRHFPNYFTEVLSQIVACLAAIYWYYFQAADLTVVVVSMLSLHVAKIIISNIFYGVTFRGGAKDNNDEFTSLIRFATPLWVNNIVLLVNIQGDRALVSFFGDDLQIASYTLAFTISFGIYGFVSRSMMQIIMPIWRKKTESMRVHMITKVRIGMWFLFLFLMVLFYFGFGYFVGYVNPEYIKVSDFLVLVMLSNLIKLPRASNNCFFTMMGLTNIVLKYSLVKLFVLMVMVILLMSGVSIFNVLVVSVVSEVLVYMCSEYELNKKITKQSLVG